MLHAGAVQRQAHRPAQAWQGGAAAGDQEGQEGDGGGAGSGDAGGGERGGAERDIRERIGEPARGVDQDERRELQVAPRHRHRHREHEPDVGGGDEGKTVAGRFGGQRAGGEDGGRGGAAEGGQLHQQVAVGPG